MHSAQGPQALDDNQPNFSHRFSAAWKIHRPICQTWNGLLHSLEFHCCPQTTSLGVTRFLLLWELTVRPYYRHFISIFFSCSFSRTCFSPTVCWSQELGTGIKATASFDGLEYSSVDENKSESKWGNWTPGCSVMLSSKEVEFLLLSWRKMHLLFLILKGLAKFSSWKKFLQK